jgi:hypothetical protein
MRSIPPASASATGRRIGHRQALLDDRLDHHRLGH